MNKCSDASSLFSAARACLAEPDPAAKVADTAAAAAAWVAGSLDPAPPACPPAGPPAEWVPLDEPGRPPRPQLVAARDLPRRGLGDAVGRAALIHAVAHIEFNAINLAWDAVQRFVGMPRAFYADWVQVALEESRHFGLMRERLQALGYDYGDFPAHDGLWDMARRTRGDVLERMALVPRVLEARGLDVTPGMIARLRAVGDEDSAARLAVILREEVGHVAAGSRWFRYCCAARGLEPIATAMALIGQHLRGEVRCPLNRPDRLRAGFDAAELDALEARCAQGRQRPVVPPPNPTPDADR